MTKVKKNELSDFTEGPLLGRIIKFTIPIMATGLLQTLYNTSDMIVVGRFASSSAMGAVGVCGSLINLIIGLFMGMSVGVGVTVAQYIGAKAYEQVKRIIHTALLASIICGVVVALFGFIFAEPLLTLMGTPEENLAEAVPYMKAYFVGIPAVMVYNFLAAAIRSSGDTKRPLIILAISGLVNVTVNLIMVIVFGLGAVGVGIATTVAQYLSMILLLVHMLRLDNCCRVIPREIRIDRSKLIQIVRIGIPSGIQSSLFSLSNVLIQSTINTYGTIVVDGNAAAISIEGFVYIAMNSFYQTSITFTGQNFGARKIDRIKRITLLCTVLVTIVGFTLGFSAYIFGHELLSIFAPASDVNREAIISAGLQRLGIISVTYFLCGVMEVASGVLRGMGKTILPLMVSLIGSCALRIVWIFTVCRPFFPNDIRVLYIAYPITWIVTLSAHFIFILLTLKRFRKQDSITIR